MFKNLLIFLFSFFLLFSCSKKNNEEVISEPTDEEVAMNIYAEAVEALKGVHIQMQFFLWKGTLIIILQMKIYLTLTI